MNNKLMKKLRDKEEKLLDAIEDLKTFLEDTEDEQLASMGEEFSEVLLDFLYENDSISLNDIRTVIEEEM